MFRFTTAATAAALLAASAALAQDNPFGMHLKARQGVMNFFALNVGVLGGMARGDAPYDAAAAQTAAANLLGAASLDLAVLFPQGSDSGSIEGTRALPAIWTDMEDVGAKIGGLRAAAEAMNAAAGTDLAALQAAMGPVGQACSACHTAYRVAD